MAKNREFSRVYFTVVRNDDFHNRQYGSPEEFSGGLSLVVEVEERGGGTEGILQRSSTAQMTVQ